MELLLFLHSQLSRQQFGRAQQLLRAELVPLHYEPHQEITFGSLGRKFSLLYYGEGGEHLPLRIAEESKRS